MDNTQQLFFVIIYLKMFVLAVVVALPSYMLKVPNERLRGRLFVIKYTFYIYFNDLTNVSITNCHFVQALIQYRLLQDLLKLDRLVECTNSYF